MENDVTGVLNPLPGTRVFQESVRRRDQGLDDALTLAAEELFKPDEVEGSPVRPMYLHGLRGLGGGNGLSVPRLLAHATISS